MVNTGPSIVPAVIILVGLAAERLWVASRWARENPFLALAARWAWRAAAVLLALVSFSIRATLYRSLATGPFVDTAAAVVLMMVAAVVLWWIARPAVPGFPLNLPGGRPQLALWALFALAEAFTRQSLFATTQAALIPEGVNPWWVTGLLLAAVALPALGTGHVRQDDLLLWVGTLGGNGLAVAAGSLWAAIVWDLWLVFVLGLRSQHQEVTEDHVGQNE